MTKGYQYYPGYYGYQGAAVPAKEEFWESDVQILNACGQSPEGIEVFIKPLAKVKIDALMEKYPSIEWLAYLLGDPGTMIINDIFIPKQKVTATSVTDIDCPEFNTLPIIGVIHSHHGMGTGFSGTDHEFINGNHDISLVVSKGACAGQVRWKTPCGCFKIVPAKVKPYLEIDFDKKSFLEQTAAISTMATTYATGAGYTPPRTTPATSPNTAVNANANASPGAGDGWSTGNQAAANNDAFDDEQSLVDALEESFGKV